MTIKKVVGSLAFLGTCALGVMAHAIGFDTYGNSSAKPPPKVAPATQCSLDLYAAYAKNKTDKELDTYAFSGTCDINVAPEGSKPVVQNVKVRIVSEWSPKMRRASELVTVIHPDKTVQFSTWATCNKDPFLPSVPSEIYCTEQNMGANSFSYFLRKEDVPFSRMRANELLAGAFTARVKSRAEVSTIGKLTTVTVPSARVNVPITTTIAFDGGPNACPAEVDFGDGSPREKLMFANYGDLQLTKHVFTKPGSYKVKAKALPGCSGEVSATVNVYGGAAGSGR